MNVCSTLARAQTKLQTCALARKRSKSETETALTKCAEIKGIKSHEAPAAVRAEGFPLPDTLNLSHLISTVNSFCPFFLFCNVITTLITCALPFPFWPQSVYRSSPFCCEMIFYQDRICIQLDYQREIRLKLAFLCIQLHLQAQSWCPLFLF